MSLSDHPAENFPSPLLADRVVGAMVGLALGDAFGAPVEWLDHTQIAALHPGGVRDFLANPARNLAAGQVTDDTDMAFLTAESLVARRGLDMDDIAMRLPTWAQTRSDLGATALAGIAALRAGTHWSAAGSSKDPSSGCLPRCAPVALFVPPSAVAAGTADCCRVTHRHTLAIASCVAQNTLVSLLVRGAGWSEATTQLVRVSTPAEFGAAWSALFTALAEGPLPSPGAPAVFVEAFHCTDRAADAESAVIAAVALGGDTDTRGAVAGLLAGARWGIASFPSRWMENCPAPPVASGLAHRLCSTANA